MSFSALGLPEPITRGVRAAGYTIPTPIQLQAIPLILPGHDLVAAAQTGSGKTAAFLLPILARLMHGHHATRALILVPTRELAAQVEENAHAYSKFARVHVGAVYGGVPIAPQERMIRNEGVDLLIATPGRLLDLHGRHSVSLEEVEVLVLDEADRMVDMGFAPDLQRILKLLPAKRQTLMFSATMPPELNKVAQNALHNPHRLDLAPPSRPAESIDQTFFPVPRHLKVDLLAEILVRADDHTAIVFTRTKRGADRLYRVLKARGLRVGVIHGDRSQGQREKALADFKRGRVEVLVATDIASRGIDVDDVTHVVNFDVPRTPEDYVHRIGRTGRMDAAGDALTLVSPEEEKDAREIERFLGRRIPSEHLSDFDYKARASHGPHESRSHGEHAERSSGRGSRSGHGSHSSASREPRAERPAPASSGPEHGRRPVRNATDRRSRRRM
ncbi:MAG TPA: DEAD/DEAH box helicase [Candidatus Eisenbacteria bacterium]|nr:DEAD/DEAH box helicase [Candidatus Eisenbacteria bacterium]